MPARMSEQDEDAVLELYVRGLTLIETAAQLGCSHWTVRNVLKRSGVPVRSCKFPYELSAVDWVAVVSEYEGLEFTVEEICKRHYVATPELYMFLALRPDIKRRRARKIRVRTRQRKAHDRQLDAFDGRARLLPRHEYSEMIQEYLDGVAVRSICMMYRVSHGTLYDELERRGLPQRAAMRPAWWGKYKGEQHEAEEGGL